MCLPYFFSLHFSLLFSVLISSDSILIFYVLIVNFNIPFTSILSHFLYYLVSYIVPPFRISPSIVIFWHPNLIAFPLPLSSFAFLLNSLCTLVPITIKMQTFYLHYNRVVQQLTFLCTDPTITPISNFCFMYVSTPSLKVSVA